MTGLGGFDSGDTADSTVFQVRRGRLGSCSGRGPRRWGSEERAGSNLDTGLRREAPFEGLRRVGFPFSTPAEDQSHCRLPGISGLEEWALAGCSRDHRLAEGPTDTAGSTLYTKPGRGVGGQGASPADVTK